MACLFYANKPFIPKENVIKIAIITDSYFSGKGGSEKHIRDLIAGLNSKDFHFDIIQLTNRLDIQNITDCSNTNVKLHHLPVKRVYGYSGLKAAYKIYKILNKENISISLSFHEMSDILNAITPHKAKKLSSRRDTGFKRSFVIKRIIQLLNYKFEVILCPSKAVKHQVVLEGVNEKSIQVLYNGIDCNKFVNSATKSQSEKNKALQKLDIYHISSHINLVSIGNLNTWKGHEYLIEAVHNLKQKGIACQLAIFGDGPSRNKLADQIKHLKLEDAVHLQGYQDNAGRYISDFDLMVLPSLTEGLSNALLESAASAIPIISTSVGGNPEITIDGVNGTLVNPKDSEAIAQAIAEYLPGSDNHKKASIASRALAESNFSIQTMITSYIKLLSLKQSL